MSSAKWYWTEPFRFGGSATVLEQRMWQGKPAYILDRALFYPEGGGQLGDRGMISFGEEERTVCDTQIGDDGMIFVIVNAAFGTDVVGKMIEQRVDEEWRRRQMAQHTGQHLLSRLLQDRYQAPTISARLGERSFSVDLESPLFTDAQLLTIEEELNQMLLEDRPIRAWFPSTEELKELPLRKQPSVQEQIRIVQVEGFDVTPCGGTHCIRTGQVGMVHIQNVEKYKQLIRLTACAGLDAVRDFHQKERVMREAQVFLSATPETLVSQIEGLRMQQDDLQTQLKRRTNQCAAQEARSLLGQVGGNTCVSAKLEEDDIEYARALSKELAKQACVTSLVACPTVDGVFVVLDRARPGSEDLGTILKEVLASQGGKGGGGALHAEGRAPKEEICTILEQRLS